VAEPDPSAPRAEDPAAPPPGARRRKKKSRRGKTRAEADAEYEQWYQRSLHRGQWIKRVAYGVGCVVLGLFGAAGGAVMYLRLQHIVKPWFSIVLTLGGVLGVIAGIYTLVTGRTIDDEG
jgi:hypothetical protein